MTENIKVIVRLKPLPEGSDTCLQIDNSQRISVVQNKYVEPFQFDRVFKSSATQSDVFEEIRPFVVDAVNGYNTSIFAYG